MNWETFSWILVVNSLIGNVFVVKQKVAGQWMWAIGNIGWVGYNLYLNAYAQATLFTVYTMLCIWGIIEWSRKNAKSATPQAA